MDKSQQYPPDSYGDQNSFKECPTNNIVTENGKELYYPKGGRVRGHAVASTWESRSGSEGLEGSEATKWPQPGSREAALREPGVPPASLSYG